MNEKNKILSEVKIHCLEDRLTNGEKLSSKHKIDINPVENKV
jgi:hypothetical protein